MDDIYAKKLVIEFIKNYKKEKEDIFSVYIEKEKMQHFIQTVFFALKDNKKIAIFGDYDVDGIGSTALMIDILRDIAKHCRFKAPQVTYKIPSRADHYGITAEIFMDMKSKSDLVITLDNGTHKDFFSALKESDKENLLIVDHHPNGDFKDEICVINPNKDGSVKICTGILLEAIFQTARRVLPGYKEARAENHFHDLVAMTLISDMASLNNGIVRAFVESGIKKASDKNRALFKKMMPSFKGPPTLSTFAFEIIPLINSIGRMSDSPGWAVELLLEKEENDSFFDLFEKAKETNAQRKEASDFYTKKLIAALRLTASKEGTKLLIAHDENIPIGINGIIASNIFSYYGIDTVVTSRNISGGGTVVGSGRGSCVKNHLLNLHEIISDEKKDVGALHFGGHNQAVGVKISNQEILLEALNKYNEEDSKPSNAIFKKEKSYITSEPLNLDNYKKMSQAFYEIVNGDIKFMDDFYVNIRARIIGFEEYRNGFAKIMLLDDKMDDMSFLIKTDESTNYFTTEEKIFSISVQPSPLQEEDGVVPAQLFEFNSKNNSRNHNSIKP